MASNFVKTPLLRAFGKRNYAQIVPVGGLPEYTVQSSTLPSKLVVVTAENQSPISRVSIVFKAGSRNETGDNLGVSHVLRTAAGLSTKNASQFAILRNIQQVGANLTATSDRETITYTLEGTRDAVEEVLPFLREVATQQIFKPWEVSDLSDRLKLDLAARPLEVRAIDLLHKAAYRTGLGNSLFIPKFQIGKISTETLQHFVASNFTTSNAAVIGLGLSNTTVKQFATGIELSIDGSSSAPSPYKGGEIRSDKGGDVAYVAIAGEGAPITNTKAALATAVLGKVLAAGPQVKWSSNDNGLISKAIQSEEFAAKGLWAAYADTGLVGVLIASRARTAGKIVEAAVRVLKSGSVTDADVARGKNLLKTSLLSDLESGTKAVQYLAKQAVYQGSALSPTELAAAVDSVTTADVQTALQKVGQKLSIASVGNLANVPYADELK